MHGEQVDVCGQAKTAEYVPDFVTDLRRRDPYPWCHVAEAQPGQPGAQGVPPGALSLGNAEHCEHPTVFWAGCPAVEDPPVALGQDRPRPVRQPIPCRTADPVGDQNAAALEPRDRRTYGRLVDPEARHHADERSHRQPPAGFPGVKAVDRDDQRPGLRRTGLQRRVHLPTLLRPLDCRHAGDRLPNNRLTTR